MSNFQYVDSYPIIVLAFPLPFFSRLYSTINNNYSFLHTFCKKLSANRILSTPFFEKLEK